ncbi:hypothetical protein D6C77_09637 [Aureobasidium pullulans]|nr:hypothetical protein D6C77_09637 [Aureobasidium pullulans]
MSSKAKNQPEVILTAERSCREISCPHRNLESRGSHGSWLLDCDCRHDLDCRPRAIVGGKSWTEGSLQRVTGGRISPPLTARQFRETACVLSINTHYPSILRHDLCGAYLLSVPGGVPQFVIHRRSKIAPSVFANLTNIICGVYGNGGGVSKSGM